MRRGLVIALMLACACGAQAQMYRGPTDTAMLGLMSSAGENDYTDGLTAWLNPMSTASSNEYYSGNEAMQASATYAMIVATNGFRPENYSSYGNGSGFRYTEQLLTSGNITVACWVKREFAAPIYYGSILGQGRGDPNSMRDFHMRCDYWNSSKVQFLFENESNKTYFANITASSPALNDWMHIAVTVNSDDKVAIGYVNGAETVRTNFAGTLTFNSFGGADVYSFAIGPLQHSSAQTGGSFLGVVDDVRVYDGAIKTAEYLAGLYNYTVGEHE